jgi:hypothetical protein
MARAFGLAIAPFGVMAEGRLLSKKQVSVTVYTDEWSS